MPASAPLWARIGCFVVLLVPALTVGGVLFLLMVGFGDPQPPVPNPHMLTVLGGLIGFVAPVGTAFAFGSGEWATWRGLRQAVRLMWTAFLGLAALLTIRDAPLVSAGNVVAAVFVVIAALLLRRVLGDRQSETA